MGAAMPAEACSTHRSCAMRQGRAMLRATVRERRAVARTPARAEARERRAAGTAARAALREMEEKVARRAVVRRARAPRAAWPDPLDRRAPRAHPPAAPDTAACR